MKIIQGNIVDPIKKEIFQGEIHYSEKIEKIIRKETSSKKFILPGLVNSHVHIESSMLSPSEFSKQVVKHGTIAAVTDPHEIANVMGIDGINFMIENAKHASIKIFFGAPSCVPATSFETSGNIINSIAVKQLLERDDIWFLSEMMDFPGVLNDNKEVAEKLKWAKTYHKPIDGHAPGVKGKDLEKYIHSGVSTDHECFTIEEALEKIKLGMIVQIREGSAAKNFENLFPVIDMFPESVMICTDDSHPDDLLHGHINQILVRAWNKGLDYFNVLKTATINPIKHYHLPVGYLQEGQPADFIVSTDKYLTEIHDVIIEGKECHNKNTINETPAPDFSINNFKAKPILIDSIKIHKTGEKVNVISVEDGELITKKLTVPTKEIFNPNGELTEHYNKIVVINRYIDNPKPIIGIIKNFNLKEGAIASTIAHDSHNIIAVGKNDEDLLEAINLIIASKGGIAASHKSIGANKILPLEIAGLMTFSDTETVAKKYHEINSFAKEILGSNLNSPFMTLSFMSLLVIPELKIGDKGMFDIRSLEFVPLFID
jgi:adenine deaminase